MGSSMGGTGYLSEWFLAETVKDSATFWAEACRHMHVVFFKPSLDESL